MLLCRELRHRLKRCTEFDLRRQSPGEALVQHLNLRAALKRDLRMLSRPPRAGLPRQRVTDGIAGRLKAMRVQQRVQRLRPALGGHRPLEDIEAFGRYALRALQTIDGAIQAVEDLAGTEMVDQLMELRC